MNFIQNNLELIGAVCYGVINLFNAVTPHWQEQTGLSKVIGFITEAFSILASIDEPSLVKLPLQVKSKKK